MKLKAYKTNLGLFVEPQNSVYGEHRLNGSIPLVTGWNHLKDVHEITSYEVLSAGQNLLVEYTLKISSVACDEIPLSLSPEQVSAYYDDVNDEYRWRNFEEYRALYKPVYEQQPSEWKESPFELTVIREIQIDNYEKPIEMKIGTQVKMQSPSWNVSDELAKVVLYEDIERILTPEFLLHERPCQLAPTQLYSVIRNYVKVNINPKAAFVSSDYDFCFSVKKRIAIKPVTTKTEVFKPNGRRYATPKFTQKTVASKDEIIFEMAPKEYQKYPVLTHWYADNLKDMAEQLKQYLDKLMAEINAEVEECQHCNGCGAIVKKIDTNDRSV